LTVKSCALENFPDFRASKLTICAASRSFDGQKLVKTAKYRFCVNFLWRFNKICGHELKVWLKNFREVLECGSPLPLFHRSVGDTRRQRAAALQDAGALSGHDPVTGHGIFLDCSKGFTPPFLQFPLPPKRCGELQQKQTNRK